MNQAPMKISITPSTHISEVLLYTCSILSAGDKKKKMVETLSLHFSRKKYKSFTIGIYKHSSVTII